MTETISVRAHTVPKNIENKHKSSREPKKRDFDRILVFDCETTTDLYQNLKFGYYEVYQHHILEHKGIFYDKTFLNKIEHEILVKYCKENKIKLFTVEEFREIFLKEVYALGSLCIGFNLSFDLTRICIKSSKAKFKQDTFSLEFSKNLEYPRLHITHVTNALSFIKWVKSKSGKQFVGNFVDLRTLCYSLTDKKHTLESACKIFKTEYQKTKSEHGKITAKYIEYCINDVKSTYSLYKNTKKDFDSYRLFIPVTESYSPASIGKELLRMTNINSFLEQNPNFEKKILGYIMTAYFGGRTEDKIRKIPTLVDVLDFLSMYPTVCILQNLWKFVIANNIEYKDSTQEVTKFIDGFTHSDLQNKENWTRLQGIVLIAPQEDILPVRARYGQKNLWNIGINYLTSKTPLWYSVSDVIASKLYTGKTPKILKAYKFVPVGVQKGLKTINIHGIKINPYKQDLFKELIEYRKNLQNKNDPREKIIKIITNAISYGIFVEIQTHQEQTKIPIDVYGLEHFTENKSKIEKSGYMFNPIIGICITSASRLLLAATEIILSKHDTTHAYCDTDSMMIPPLYTKEIQQFFQKLNPYSFDADIFKVERRNVLFYGISAKRYCLYSFTDEKIRICDDNYSSHGLGHLLDPFSGTEKDDWHKQIWLDILDLHYGNTSIDKLREKYETKHAISKLVISSPNILSRLDKFNHGKDYQDQIKPSNFALVGFSNVLNKNTKESIKPFAPFVKPAREAVFSDFVDYNEKSGLKMRGKQYWKPFWDIFWEYLNHLESKFDGIVGVLQRKHVVVSEIKHIGKESNNLDESEILGVSPDGYEIYENFDDIDKKFAEITQKVLDLKPKDVKGFRISKQTLWNVKQRIKQNKTSGISNRIKVQLVCNFVLFTNETI